MHILDQLSSGGPSVSFEFFPPKNPADRARLLQTIARLDGLRPGSISITYGAGGGSRDLTLDLVETLRDRNPTPHLTCVGHTRGEIRGMLTRLATAGVGNILALRGDPPKAASAGPGDFPHAADLVSFIREFKRHRDPRGFGIGVAGFPEGHPSTPDRMAEMDHLKAKVDAGADYICTQLFLDNHDFHDFRDRCELAGIRVPIIAGIMPVTSVAMMKRIATLAGGARFPAKLIRAFQRAGSDPEAVRRAGIHHAAAQCSDLLHHQVAGLHFYTLNQADAVLEIGAKIGLARDGVAA
ncbi:methylenetetrahydrofolate reductase [NAD(P)H] [Luteolibacter yonseiensis]|uniref:Methylenetetrahydrofolate reductase n=1 Tax=Luteolibacter yonseiensis TaxID=1144680 RepID=A0A934R5Q5_9BACT|nr:methylenetetrahydrofolate reductase [NAD(P)H] [Luteolibacter yonseiensis]MBK1815940.1 methylenetetrahydrofolate reductase [NAD(P)H] [Luteolibacter yonseiensis]